MTLNELLVTLTIKQALEWYQQDEKFTYIADTYDQVLTSSGKVIEERVYLIESKFMELLGVTV